MMTVSPQGQIYLCKTPLENDYKNQLTFNNQSDQINYFNSTVQRTFDNYTYIKKDNVIKVSENIDKIINCNYLFYNNLGFPDETGQSHIYYCFITSMEYINENTTAIKFETDVFQTWYFNINYKRCFVEREHVSDDTVGKHTIPENVETGEYIINSESSVSVHTNDYDIVFAVTEYLTSTGNMEDSVGGIYGGVFSGLQYLVVKDGANANAIMQIYAKKGKSDAIVNMFMVPALFSEGVSFYTQTIESITATYGLIQSINSVKNYTTTGTTKSTTLNGYVPKNNKMLTYPFQYLLLNNNVGSCLTYRYEDFSTNAINFSVDSCIIPGGSTKIAPEYYKGLSINYNESLSIGKIPASAWTNDLYANWQAQNAVNIPLAFANAGIQLGSGLALMTFPASALAGAGTVASGLNSIVSTMSQIYEHSIMPPSSQGDVGSGDISFALGFINPKLYKMSIKREYAVIIDDYFSMFGYKVNEVKIPNITGRSNWNFVKTIDCNFEGNIPQSDLNVIKTMFNNGVTLWHNPSTMYDYAQSNGIV